jgi:hypothetical protein
VQLADPGTHLRQSLDSLYGLPLHKKQIKKLKARLSQLVVQPEAEWKTTDFDATLNELGENRSYFKSGVVATLRREHGIQSTEEDIHLVLNRRDRRFEVETDIPSRFGLDLEATHSIVEKAALGIAGLNRRLQEMQEYQAVASFAYVDLPLIEARLRFLINQLGSDQQEEQFLRVVRLAGLPEIEDPSQVNIHRLLEVRESPDCREFRTWLARIGNESDEAVAERITSVRSRIGTAISSGVGRAGRLVVTTGLGMVPVVGPLTGLAASAVDSFLLEEVFPRSGAISFLSEAYPSVFDDAPGKA